MDPKQYETLVDKLEKITRLLAIQTVKDQEKEQDKMPNKTLGYANAALANFKKKQQKTSRQTQAQTPAQAATAEGAQ